MNKSFPIPQIRTRRKIVGVSAILLPLADSDQIDWRSFTNLVERTIDAGLVPAVNMDTGYAHLIDEPTRQEVLQRTRSVIGRSGFVAGAYVADQDGSPFDATAYRRQIDSVVDAGGTPIVFQSFGLTQQSDDVILESYGQIAGFCDEFLAFELGTMFAPFGKIYSLDVFRGLLELPQCRGAKHSSLRRALEWERLQLRDAMRPEFQLLTGNDLAIDMVIYGSDYLLGLCSLAPDAFARRDALWEAGDPAFYELNDLLQYLGFFAFREPVPAYKHSAAMFLHQRGWIASDRTHPDSPQRPASDLAVLQEILNRIQAWIA